MIARLAYLTSPGPNRFVLNIQPFGSELTSHIEISKAHLANILIDGLSWSLRETSINRVPDNNTQTEDAKHERAGA